MCMCIRNEDTRRIQIIKLQYITCNNGTRRHMVIHMYKCIKMYVHVVVVVVALDGWKIGWLLMDTFDVINSAVTVV